VGRNATRDDLDRHVTDARAFDAAVVTGVLRWYNNHAGSVSRLPNQRLLTERCFGWIEAVLVARARAVDQDATPFRWKGDDAPGDIARMNAALLFLIGPLRQVFDGGKTMVWFGRRLGRDEWLREVLKDLPTVTHMELRSSRDAQPIELVKLTSVQRCVAYGLSVLLTNRHGLGHYIRPCAFIADEVRHADSFRRAHAAHYFLATGIYGKPPEGKPRRFCSTAHANCHRQREWRRKKK